MEFLRKEKVREWCNARGLRISPDRFLYYDNDNQHCFSIGLEDTPSRVIALADHLVPTWDDVLFEGALLWIRSRDIWGDYSEKVGAMIVQQMCKGP